MNFILLSGIRTDTTHIVYELDNTLQEMQENKDKNNQYSI